MDGTLWDSVDNIVISWNEASRLHQEGMREVTRQQLLGLMGKTMDRFAKELYPHLPEQEGMRLLHICEQAENEYLREHGAVLLGDVRGIFQKLREMGYGIYIVSNCQSGYIEAFLAHERLEAFVDDFECYGNTGRGKAENLRILIRRNQLEQYWYVGDTQGDYDACREADVPFIWAAYGFGTVKAQVLRIDSLAEITEILKKTALHS